MRGAGDGDDGCVDEETRQAIGRESVKSGVSGSGG